MRELLIRLCQEGIAVRVLYDAIGSVTTPAAVFEPLQQAGVDELQFQRLNRERTLLWKINNRDHRKIVVIDGRIAFTGGIDVSSTYASAPSSRPGPKAVLAVSYRSRKRSSSAAVSSGRS